MLPAPRPAALTPDLSSPGPQWLGWLALAVVAVFPLIEAVRVLASDSHLVLYGDQALLELGARRAIHFDQLVGPYSRVGFHQPGPAVFYLLAPFVHLLEPAGPGLYLGAIVINGAALTATVAFLWRRFGPLAALWAAAAIDLFCLCIRLGTLREPWNPYLIVAPMVLFVVLWAAGITGTKGAALWAMVIGSYEVQTHIATAIFVAAMTAILVAALVRSGWRRRQWAAGREQWGPARVTGAAALVLIWLAPLVELWRDRPNNLGLLWDFFTSSEPTPPLHQALQVAGEALTIMPFGYHDYVLTSNRSGPELGLAAVLFAAGLIAAVALGWRRRQPMSLALAGASVLGAGLGTLSLTRTAGPVYLYFAVWLAFVPLALLLAVGIALFGSTEPHAFRHVPNRPPNRPPRRPHPRPYREPATSGAGWARAAVPLVLAIAVTVAAFTMRSDLTMGAVSATTGSGPWPPGISGIPQGKLQTLQETSALTRAAEGVLRPTDRWVNFTLATPSLWPYLAGAVLALDQGGVQSTVDPASWQLYFGHERSPGRSVSVTFDLYAPGDAAAVHQAHGAVIARVDGAVLTYERGAG